MFRVLVLLFIIIPLIELYVLIKVGGLIGPALTVALVILTAIIGTFLLRQQGFATLRRVQDNLGRGVLPAAELVEGLILLICGAFLLAPGFVTDTLGFIGLIPVVRRRLADLIVGQMRHGLVSVSQVHDAETRKHYTIEGEYRRDR